MRNQVTFTLIAAVLFFFIGLFFGQETTVVNNYYNTCCETTQEVVVDTIYVQDSVDQKIINGLMEINDELYHQVQVSNSQIQQMGGEELTAQITNTTEVVDQPAEVTVNMVDEELQNEVQIESEFNEIQTEEVLPHLSDGKVEAKPLIGLPTV